VKRIRTAVIVVILICLAGAGVWWYFASQGPPVSDSEIAASGFIEADEVSVTPEIGGRVISIGAAEGDPVKAGAVLVKLDDSLLQAQARQAQAAVAVAQAGLQQAEAARDGAQRVLDSALDIQKNPQDLDTQIIAAQGVFEVAEVNLRQANLRLDQFARAAAQVQYDTAQRNLNRLLAVKADPQQINIQVDQARTALATAEANLQVVKAQIDQAKAATEVVNVQISKMALTAPASGIVTSRNAEPGELAVPGAPLLVITRLDEVTLTIYVPESRLGAVKLGQPVAVTVDSYPGVTFSGAVSHISQTAQFTPKNVQLKEERTKTVYAVKIRLSNAGQRLKAGMPADAVIKTS
jgi:HlyD family secretion protein